MDNTFTYWTASLISPQERFYELLITCGENYPNEPPKIKFVHQINMQGVNPTNGQVDNNHFFKKWNRSNTMHECLKIIRKEMESPAFKNLKQPKDNTNY